ncbi:MAG TPA: hypothetical protein DCE23_08270 [Firmicutes bacterium]|nr:hypothetical protein [Bacillota bacterium]
MNKKNNSILEKKLAENQRIRVAGKKFHIPKSIPTSIFNFILSIILLPIVLYLTFILIDYIADLVIWYLKDTSSNLIYYLISGTIVSWLFCLFHMVFKKGEVLESILNCLENMSILTYSVIYIVMLIFDIIDNGLTFKFASLFRFLMNSFISIFSALAWTTISTIIGMIVVILLSILLRSIFKRMILYVELLKARKSRCYKAICYLIKDYDFDQSVSLDYIYITNDRINVVDEDGETQEIIFETHTLPNLTEYGIAAMACLLKLSHPFFRIKSEILGLTLINTALEKEIFDERTVEIKLEDVEKLTDTFITNKKENNKKEKKPKKDKKQKKTKK